MRWLRGILALLFAAMASVAVADEAKPEAVTVDGLAGTWLKPAGATTAALIVAGSGPTDRDGNNPLGVKTDAYRQLAEALAKAGIASLRFDKRGIGASKTAADGKPFEEAAVTIQTYADDTAKLAVWMAKQPGITRTALVGHSEGGVVSLVAAGKQKVDRIVLLTSPGRPLGVILRGQFDRQPMPERLRAEIERVLDVLEKGGDPGELKAPLDQFFRPSVQPFLKSILSLDPAPLARTQPARILVIGGGSDLQIGRFDFNALVEARPGTESHWEARLTHTLKPELEDDPGQVKAYGDPSLPVMTTVVDRVIAFLAQ